MFAIFFVFTSFCSYAYRLLKSRKEIKFWLLVSLFVCSFLPKSVFREFFPLPKSVFRWGYFPLPTKSVFWEGFFPCPNQSSDSFFFSTCPNQSSVEPLFSDHPKNKAKVALKRVVFHYLHSVGICCVCVCVCARVCVCVCVCVHACMHACMRVCESKLDCLKCEG